MSAVMPLVWGQNQLMHRVNSDLTILEFYHGTFCPYGLYLHLAMRSMST